MEEFFAQLGNLLQGLFALTQSGFDTVNQVVGLVIALIAAFMMPAWRSLFSTALGATLVYILVGLLRPMLDGGAFALPDLMSMAFWMTVLALFLAFSVIVAVFFFLKTLLGGGHRHRAHAH